MSLDFLCAVSDAGYHNGYQAGIAPGGLLGASELQVSDNHAVSAIVKSIIIFLWFVLWDFGQVGVSAERKVQAPPVIISVLGAVLDYEKENLPLEQQVIRDISGKGFTGSWDATPPAWGGPGLPENTQRINTSQRIVNLLHQNNIDVHYTISWPNMLAPDPVQNTPEYVGLVLNKDNSAFEYEQTPNWDFGSEKARTAFVNRCQGLFEKIGPVEIFIIDEVVMAAPGDEFWCKPISTYWTSPTYSKASLASFQQFLSGKSFPGAETAKFPVTTIEVKPGTNCNMGLPAIMIGESNQDRLVADNDWPKSALWAYWYEWRTELYIRWIDAITTMAYDVWGKNPKWQGCAFSSPPGWYTKELGLNLDKLAKVPHLDYLVCGYNGGVQYQKIKSAAQKNGKKWGGMLELGRYGQSTGQNPNNIIKLFKQIVNDGASIIYVYPTVAFQTNRKNMPTEERKNGLYYMPEQIAAWETCVKWLERRQGVHTNSSLELLKQ